MRRKDTCPPDIFFLAEQRHLSPLMCLHSFSLMIWIPCFCFSWDSIYWPCMNYLFSQCSLVQVYLLISSLQLLKGMNSVQCLWYNHVCPKMFYFFLFRLISASLTCSLLVSMHLQERDSLVSPVSISDWRAIVLTQRWWHIPWCVILIIFPGVKRVLDEGFIYTQPDAPCGCTKGTLRPKTHFWGRCYGSHVG